MYVHAFSTGTRTLERAFCALYLDVGTIKARREITHRKKIICGRNNLKFTAPKIIVIRRAPLLNSPEETFTPLLRNYQFNEILRRTRVRYQFPILPRYSAKVTYNNCRTSWRSLIETNIRPGKLFEMSSVYRTFVTVATRDAFVTYRRTCINRKLIPHYQRCRNQPLRTFKWRYFQYILRFGSSPINPRSTLRVSGFLLRDFMNSWQFQLME